MKLMKARAGQALVEYILVIALVAVALVSSLVMLRRGIADDFAAIPELGDCATPGEGGLPPGHGGTPPGQCKKGSNDWESEGKGPGGSNGSNGSNESKDKVSKDSKESKKPK